MNAGVTKWLRRVMVSAILIATIPLSERNRHVAKFSHRNPFLGKTLSCAIYLSNEITSKQGLETGYNYELLKRFAEDNHCTVRVNVQENEHYADSLSSGQIDIYITRKDELKQTDAVKVSNVMDDLYVWGVSDDRTGERVESINKWLHHISLSQENKRRKERFRGSFNPTRLAEKGTIRSRVSPYDAILKEKAKELDWDWRLLAAIVYQESRFSIKAESHKGAKGLMQLMPAVAQKFGLHNPIDPEANITAGVQVLARIQSKWDGYGLSKEEMINFTLASYNAGDGRIKDCRNLAKSKGYDVTKWEEVVKVIPLMRNEDSIEEGIVKLGRFQGNETISYVSNVMGLYRSICTIYPDRNL